LSLNRDRGKRTEREIAKRFGGKRVGTMGGEDVFTKDFSVECKSRVAFVGEKWMAQAERNCPRGRTPLTVVHLQNKPHGKDIVMIRLADWEAWMGGGNKP
jgi:hypothetical protein